MSGADFDGTAGLGGWVALVREAGGVLAAVGPVGECRHGDLLGLALAEGYGIERVGTVRLLSRKDAAARLGQQASERGRKGQGHDRGRGHGGTHRVCGM